MACSIEITDVKGIELDPTSIHVTGTVVDCAPDVENIQVIVEMSCESIDGPFIEGIAEVDGDGSWSLVFPVTGANCRCGGSVFVRARCVTDPKCTTPLITVDPLDCVECPLVILNEPELTPSVNCNADGTASVTYKANIVNNTTGLVHIIIDCGPGGTKESGGIFGFLPGVSLTITTVCRYDTPSAPAPFVRILGPGPEFEEICPRVPIPMEPLPPCIPCPEITDLTSTVNRCTATFTGTLSPPVSGCSFQWDFGDGTPDKFTSAPTTSHVYGAPGTYSVAVVANCGDCISITTTAVNIVDCVDDPPPPGNGGNGGEGGLCKGLRWGGVILSILSALSLYICLCVPGAGAAFCWAALGLVLGAGLLLALWAIFCPKPCGSGLLLSWQIALGSGIGALYFAPCCPILWLIGAGLILTAIGTFTMWVSKCHKSFCDVMAELAIVISAVILPVLGWIAGISFLTACLNPVVAASVSTLAAVVTIALASCASS